MSSVAIPIQGPSTATTTSSSSTNLSSKSSLYNDNSKKTIVAPGLPSPTESISETSDYQRSTPSPKDELDTPEIGN